MQMLGKSARMRIARLKNNLAKSLKKNGDKSAVAFLKIARRYGAAEVYNDFAEELKHAEANPMCSMH